MTDTLLTNASTSTAANSEQAGCDQSIHGGSYLQHQPLHLQVQAASSASVPGNNTICTAAPQLEQQHITASVTLNEGMSAKKRSSETLETDLVDLTVADSEVPTTSAPPALKPPSSNKKRRVSFCKTTKPPAVETLQRPPPLNSLNQLLIMKHAASCTSLPDLVNPSSNLLISEACSTSELDLTVSPSTFIQTIVLQSKSITGSIRGEDIISEASQRVQKDSYFLTYTHEHLEAYTTDKVNAVQGNDVETLRSQLQAGHLMQASNRFGESMLHTSCRRGFTDMVEFFVNEARVSPRVRDDMGRTPMHDACWSSAAPNHDIMKMLICSAPELLLSKDKRGHSPFDYARREYWPNWVQFINEHRQFIVNSLVSSCLESSEVLKGEGTGTESVECFSGNVANQ